MSLAYAASQASGQDDYTSIRRFREMLRDQPRFFNETFTGDGTSTLFIAQKSPINDDEFFSVTVGGVVTPYTTSYPPASDHVYVDFDTGNFIFGTAPPAGTPKNVSVVKRTVRWRDETIMRALMDGLSAAFPQLWTTYVDTSLTVQQDTYDYQLPPQFNDPGIRIVGVGVQSIPSTIEPFRKVLDFERIGLTTLHLFNPNAWAPGSVLRIEYNGPYQSLGDLQAQAAELPILYAAGSLLGFGEARRSQVDTQTVQGPEQALPPGQQQAAGSWYMQQFDTLLNRLSRPMKMAGWRSTYRR